MAAAAFKLSAVYLGHSQDVKSLHATGSHLISASRDATARVWSSSDEYQVLSASESGFVNAVSSIVLDGIQYVLTAGVDTLIQAWPLGSNEPTHALVGHTSNVCCLATTTNGLIISGSWDKTVKIWRNWECIATLQDHSQAVWDVLPVEQDGAIGVLTAAADNLIRFFPSFQQDQIRYFKGHTQPVRALAAISPDTFASSANDGSIRLWSLSSGTQLAQLDGHDSFVYSLSYLPATKEIVSGGEDRSMRIWNAESGQLVQTITLPAISVWAVEALDNGDVAAGTSDGAIRIFTRAPERQASEAAIKDYEASLAGSSINATQVGDLKKTDLPGPDALLAPGKKEGQVIMVKQPNGAVEAHQWSVASESWTKIGVVVDAVGSSRKQLFQGQEYDYVFDVDVQEGVPPLKLPYNANQNPYEAAQKFLTANELPLSYLDQVVSFIEKNTAGLQMGGPAPVDPYTGAGAYQPAASSGPAAAKPAPPPVAATPSASFPHRTYLTFAATKTAPIRTKIEQLNEQLASDLSPLALTPEQLAQLDTLVDALSKASANHPSPVGVPLPPQGLAVLFQLLNWPAQLRFPALDLLRVTSLYSAPDASTLDRIAADLPSTGKDGETNSMLGLRAIANAFSTRKGGATLKIALETLIPAFRKNRSVLSKNGKVALATVVLNYSVLAVQRDLDQTSGGPLVDLVLELLEESDSEVVYRTLFAAGNLLLSPNVIGALSTTTVERLRSAGLRYASSTETRISSLAGELRTLK